MTRTFENCSFSYSGWHPMETAPRDGTEFWGLCEGDAITMFWHPELKVFCSSFRRMQMAEGYAINGKSYEDHSPVTHEPSHWMPLPDLPPRR